MHIETKCLHEGYKPGNGEPKALPIYQSTTYTYDSTEHIGQLFDLSADGHMYSRISNPTVAAVEQKIAALEGGVGALCTTSGQAASLLAVLNICTCVLHPASSTHRQLTDEQLVAAGITPGLIRLSVGLEHIDDILDDLKKGFAAIR